MKRPKIGITEWGGGFFDRAIQKVGGRAFTINRDTYLHVFDELDGVVIPGGRDVSPIFYTDKIDPETQPGDMSRDALELAFIKRALEKDIPLLGVCRGHQLINVAMGGTLIQHMTGHVGYRHTVQIISSRHLNYLNKEKPVLVNSLHHQAIDTLAEGLRITAIANDNTIEAVESPSHRFVVGVQWHPEMPMDQKFEDQMEELWYNFVWANKLITA